MNAERLLAHFERISEAPDAIARLRRFILDLAVRGKLVEQDPGDEPAEEQLERITLAKLALGRKERAFKKKKSDMSIESFRYLLPSGWASATLADLVTILNGRAYKQSELLDSGTPVLRVGNLFTSNKWYYSNLELDDDKCIDDGDLIFAWSASFGPFVWKGGRVIYHYHIWKLPLHSPVDLSLDYLYLYLLHKTAEIKGAGHGISMVHMTKEKMEGLEVPLPPLAEQHRIVAKVNELMALCDQLEAARQQRQQCRERLVAATLQRLNQPAEDPASFRQDAIFALQVLPSLTATPAQIKQLRQTILNLAVRGKLVEQDPEDEPAEELLAAITSEKQQVKGSRKASPRSADFVLDGPFGVPTSWQWTQLGAIGDWGSGSTPSRGRSDYYGGAISWFKSGELNDNKCLRGSEEKITHLALEQCSFRLNSPGDVLIAMYGATIGKLAILGEEAVTNQAVCACTPCWGVDTEYLYLFLLAQRDEFRLASEGGAQPNISKVKIVNTLIPLPPLAEQHRIVAKVDELMALCDQLEQQLNQADQQRRRLLETVLAEALGGRLLIEQEESHAAIA
jgi:type I restriction enzyme S subunit